MIHNAARRASSKGMPCDIDPLWIVTQWYEQGGRCYFSGRPMSTSTGPTLVSLDRLSSSRGYTRRNTVLVAVRVNNMKSDLKVEEFIDWCSAVTDTARAKT
jgi:hypothetical protein